MNPDSELQLASLLEAIHTEYHYDFRGYARSSLTRRLQRGKALLGCDSLPTLRDRVLAEPAAFAKLLSLLTVQVSDMFRDPEFFLCFRERIVPVLRTYPSLRIWVAGCAAGEEAYSFAIVLAEAGLLERSMIYATDIAAEGLWRAREGVYALSRLSTFSENYARSGATGSLSSYYTARYDAAIFSRNLKDHLVFSDHSLASDEVFAEVQVVSCRNVLIYFDSDLRARALDLFERALCRRGFLGLGGRERLRPVERTRAFEDFAASERWYQKR